MGALMICLTPVIALALEGDLDAPAVRSPLPLLPTSRSVSTVSSGV
jgi:hypothetical protein